MPDWVLGLTATGEQQGQDDEEQQEAREMSDNVIDIDENGNENTGEAKKRKRGAGERD